MNATKQERRLAVLVLCVSINATTNQEFSDVESIVLARQMEGTRQLGVDKIGFGARPLEQ